MKAYQVFMDRQFLSESAHRRLLELEVPVREKSYRWKQWAALAASLTLVLGVGLFALRQSGVQPPLPTSPGPVAAVIPSPAPSQIPEGSFIAQGPGEGDKLAFPAILSVDYADATRSPELAASIAFPDGSFTVELSKEDILKLFWGPEGKPAAENPKTDPGDFPLFLMNWQGYTINGSAIYDGNGDLWQLTVHGEKGEDSFTLLAAPGRIPPTCLVEDGAVVTTVLDTEVTGWYRSYDRDGDEVIEHVCTSEFLTKGVGYRFENVGAGGLRSGGEEATDLGGAKLFNAMLVNHLCRDDGGLYLDELLHTDDIPAWRAEGFDTLAQARGEADFAPYLPTEAPAGFGEFHSRLRYQEERENLLWVYWYKGYDSVEVEVYRPEGEQNSRFVPVDINVPESYDWRLYDGPICDTVPQEYQQDFYKPTFRVEDMPPETIQARGRAKDTGGMAYRFYVLHPDGTVVGYDCSGVSAEYVWSLVEDTL